MQNGASAGFSAITYELSDQSGGGSSSGGLSVGVMVGIVIAERGGGGEGEGREREERGRGEREGRKRERGERGKKEGEGGRERVKYPERLTEMKTSGTKDVSDLVTSAEEEGEL